MSDRPWERIAVVGCSGVGKSTLAARLAGVLGAPHTRLDDLFFAADWQPRPEAEFRADVARVVGQPRWVLDGNYRAVRDLVWPRATAVVWLDYSLPRCLAQLLRRTIDRCRSGEPICNGNRESWAMSFASRDSILLWLLRTHGPRRRELHTAFDDPAWAALHKRRLATPRETREWFEASFAPGGSVEQIADREREPFEDRREG